MPFMKKGNRLAGCGLGIAVSRSHKLGFTLLEMLVVVVILSLVALAIYAILNNGIKIWQKANRQLPEEDLNIFFDRVSLDIRNAFKFSGINFSGTTDKLEFSTLVNSPKLKKRTVGRVIYAYEPDAGVLSRSEQDFVDIYASNNNAVWQKLINAKALKFEYYFYDEQNKTYFWQDEYNKESLPLAVRLELEFDNGAGIKKFTKTISIPSSG